MEQTTNNPTTPDTALPYAILAEFEDVSKVKAAATRVRDEGYVNWDLHSPFPIHGIEKNMGLKPTILPKITLAGGILGLLSGLYLVWWTNSNYDRTFFGIPVPNFLQSYPYMISGKPYFSLPANVPIIFETTILLAALFTVVGLFALNRLPMLYNPLFKSKRFRLVTDDKFFVVIDADDPKFDEQQTREFLESLGGKNIEVVTDENEATGGQA